MVEPRKRLQDRHARLRVRVSASAEIRPLTAAGVNLLEHAQRRLHVRRLPVTTWPAPHRRRSATSALIAMCGTTGSALVVSGNNAAAESTAPIRRRPVMAWSCTRGFASASACMKSGFGTLASSPLPIGQRPQRISTHGRVGRRLHQRRVRIGTGQLLQREDRRDAAGQRSARRTRFSSSPMRSAVRPRRSISCWAKRR